MAEFTFIAQDVDEADFQPPPYGVAGRILIEIEWGCDDVTVLDYDGDTSVFWLFECLGIEWLIDAQLELPGPGIYLLEDVVGHYYRGDGWMTDDDEEWEVGRITRTTLDTLT